MSKIRKMFDRDRVSVDFIEPTRTQQHMKNECDVNSIMSKWHATGLVEHLATQAPKYVDIDSISYKEACDTVLRAEDAFASLPSSLRSRFKNDPSEFLTFVNDKENFEEMVKLGLAKKIENVSENSEKPASTE